MYNKNLIFVILIFLFFAQSSIAGPVYAPQGSSYPTIISSASDYNGEIDIKWLNMNTSNDITPGIAESYIVYFVYRKPDTDFSSRDTAVVMTEGVLADTVTQTVSDGYPQSTFTFWSDTSLELINNTSYYYSIIAFDRFDNTYSLASNTAVVVCDTQGPELKYLTSVTPAHLGYIQKSNVPIAVTAYENLSLVDGNLRLHFGFTSDTNNLNVLNGVDSVAMSVTNAETQNYYIVTGLLPVINSGFDTAVVYWITGTDNAKGLADEPNDLTPDGNQRTSSMLRALVDTSTAAILYIDAVAPLIESVVSPDSLAGYISGADTLVILNVSDNMYIETGNFVLHYKKSGGITYSAPMNFNGLPQSGQFSAVLPLSQFADKDIIKFWVSGRDKAGNIAGATTFISEATAKTVIIDTAGPSVVNFNVFNGADSSIDLTFSKNELADSIYYFEVVIIDSVAVDTLYIKLFDRETNVDSTAYMVGSETIYLDNINDTLWSVVYSGFINDGKVYPLIYLIDTLGNINIFSSSLFGATVTQVYGQDNYTITVNSDTPTIISITHINNNYSDHNTEISVGDSIVFYFNNDLNTQTLAVIENSIINQNGKTLGTVSEYIWISDTHLIITLPADYNFISGDTFGLAAGVRDIFGNYADTLLVSVINDSASPIIKAVSFINNDTTTAYSTRLSAGDTIIIEFSEPMDTTTPAAGAIADLENYIKINFASAKSFGAPAYIDWYDSKTLAIELGAGFNIADGDTLSLSSGIKDIYGIYADTTINSIYYSVIFDTAGANIMTAYLDTVYDTTGRTINVSFSEPVVTAALIPANFTSSLNITNVISHPADTDKCYIIFSNIVRAGIDTIALTTNIQDISITGNYTTDISSKVIVDIDSPYITNIYVLNNDTAAGSTRISAGDTLVIVFSEPMSFSGLTKAVFIDSFPISGRTTPDTYGNFSFMIMNDSKELHILLGAGVTIVHGDTINPSALITDLSGNPDITGDTKIISDSAGPVLINFTVLNNDTALNSYLSVGDTIIFYFSEPLDTASLVSKNPNNIFLVNGTAGAQFGATQSWNYGATGNTAAITLTTGFTIKYGDTISLSGLNGIKDIYLNLAPAGYHITFTDSIPPHIILTSFINNDTTNTTFSQGDTIIIKFSEQIDQSFFNIANFSFSNASSSFGAGAASIFTDTLHLQIRLGANPVLFSGDTLFISSITDLNNNLIISPFNVTYNDTEPPIILSTTFTDADSSSDFSAGDTFTIIFSEPMKTSSLPDAVYAAFSDTIYMPFRNLGANVATRWLNDTTLNIALGTGFTARHNDQYIFTNVLKDSNGIAYADISNTYSMGILKDTAGPFITSAILDAVSDSYCKTLIVTYNVAVDTLATAIDTANYFLTSNTVLTAQAVNSRTIKLRALKPISATAQTLTVNANVLDENGGGNRSTAAINIIDTLPLSVLSSKINVAGDTLNLKIDIYFNKALKTSSAGSAANYGNVSISSIIFPDSTVARLNLSAQFIPLTDSVVVSQYIRDYSDSNILNDTAYTYPVDTVRPYLTMIDVINNDSNTDISQGDTIVLYFSEAINTALVNVSNIKQIMSNINFGDTETIALSWSYYNTILKIGLGANPSIVYPSYINPQDTNVFTDYSGNQDTTQIALLIPDNYNSDSPTAVIMQDTDLPYANTGYDNDSAINIWWSQPVATDVDSYAVYISTNGGVYTLVGYTANRYYNYTNLNYHYRYSAAVRAIDRSGRYSDTSVVTATIISDTYATKPAAPYPTNPNYNINFDTDGIMNWAWTTADTDIVFYTIYVDSGYGYVYYDTTSVKSFQLTGIYRNSYSLKVTATDSAGNTSDTSFASIYVTVDTGAVTPPSNVIHTDNAMPGYDNDTALQFSWTANTDTDFGFYQIWYNYNSGAFNFVCTAVVNSYILNVTNPGTYILRVYSADSAGNISLDSAVSAPVIVDTSVQGVTLLQPLNLLTKITVNNFVWSSSIDANTYILQISRDTFATYIMDAQITANTTSAGITLDSGAYQWRLIAKDNAGNIAASSPAYGNINIDTFVTAPTILYPANNYDTDNHYPSFSWTITDADTYIWHFGKDTGAGFLIVDSGVFGKNVNTCVVYTRMQSDTYYWFVAVMDNAGNTNVTDSYILRLRGVDYFDAFEPITNSETTNIRPMFKWQSAIGAEYYYLVYSKNQVFSNYYVSQTTANTHIIVDTSMPNTIATGDTIYWYVVGTNALGDTNKSQTRNILIDGFAALPDTTAPIADALTRDTNVRFSWSKPSDANYYQLFICDTITFSTGVRTVNITPDTQLYYDTILLNEGNYYWYLKAFDRFNNETQTVIKRIEIDYTVGKANLIEPLNNYGSTDRTPIMRWSQVADASYYTLQISGDSAFNTTLFNIDTALTVYTISILLPDSIYYWRVITRDTAGNQNASDTFLFIVDNETPAIILYADNSILSGNNYTGLIIEKNIDTGYAVVNNETAYFTFIANNSVSCSFIVNLNTLPGVNNVYFYVRDKAGLASDTTLILYQSAIMVEYNSADTNIFAVESDSEILITSNEHEMKMSIVLNDIGINDTISLDIKINNSTPLPLLILIQSIADSAINYDTRFAPRLYETRNSAISIKVFDRNANRIEDDPEKISLAKIEFEIDKNILTGEQSPQAFGIFTVSNNRWYEINDVNMAGGSRLVGDYIYSDTSIFAKIKHFSVYAIAKKSLLYSDNLENIAVFPNPFVPYDGNYKTGRPFNEINGGIHFGIDSDNDGKINFGLPIGSTITVYTLLGERVGEAQQKANGIMVWDARDKSGAECASGLYIALIKYNGKIVSKRIAIVR